MKHPWLTLLILGAAPFAAAQVDEPAALAPPPLPANLPCRVVEGERPQFPVRLLRQGVLRGTVRTLLHIDATGAVNDLLIVAYTRRHFADEAHRALKTWKFEPARVNGEYVDTILDLTFEYESGGVNVIEKHQPAEPPPADLRDGFEYQPCALRHLDGPLVARSTIRPAYPQEWELEGISGRIAVEFYIDETGRTRFAMVSPDADTLLAKAALWAVRQWRFEPPMSGNRPVLVRARQIFSFGHGGASS